MSRTALLVTATLLAAAPGAVRISAAQPPDPVRAGYQRLHAGDSDGAHRHFEDLLRQAPDDLRFRLGSLMARMIPIANDNALIPAYERDLDTLIALANARYARSRRDTTALRYLAAAYMLRAQFRFEYDKGMWGAARDAAKAKGYGETYAKAHPEDADAGLPLGLYNYYVDLAPTLFKMVRFLLFLPAGSRVDGLKQIERAANAGDVMAPLALQTLIEIYSEYEGRPADAIARAEQLQQRFPENDDFAMTAAGVYAGPALEDHERAAGVYGAIVKRRQNDSTVDGLATRYKALLALARERREQWRMDEAVSLLGSVIDGRVSTPVWATPIFLLSRANLRGLINDPAGFDDLTRVQSEFKGTNWAKNADGLRKWMEAWRANGEAAEFAALIPGNRLAAERRWPEAQREYEAQLARMPGSTWAPYRLAVVTFLIGPPDRSLARFTSLGTDRRASSALRALALLHVGRVHDLAGQRAQALAAYKKVIDDYEDEGAAGLARVGLITPYRQPPS